MEKSFEVELHPLPFYHKYKDADYYLFGLKFRISTGEEPIVFRSECSDSDIKDIIHEIELLEAGEAYLGKLYFPVPYIVGNYIVFPFSFLAQKDANGDPFWTFRYKRNQNAENFDFQADIERQQLLLFRDSLKAQFESFDFSDYGKTTYFTFSFPEKALEWCYSASDLETTLNSLCKGHRIDGVYVGAGNYTDPLRVKENFVNYYLGPEMIIQTDDLLLDLLVHACGLVEFRWFKKEEYTITGPLRDFIADGKLNYCEIAEMFKLNYQDAAVESASVSKTDCWPWRARGFDKNRLGNPIELPETIAFKLDNDNCISVTGWDDDFAVKMTVQE